MLNIQSFSTTLERIKNIDSIPKPQPLTSEQIKQIDDSRFLAMMTKSINQAGFSWRVIEAKWENFEKVFYGFNIKKLASLPQEEWDKFYSDKRIIRNPMKIKSIQNNLQFILNVQRNHGSFSYFIAHWDISQQADLLLYLKKQGSRLGGITGQRFLRYMGKDVFMLTPDVMTALRIIEPEISDFPTSKSELQQIQNMFNFWHQETGYSYTYLSQLLSYSVNKI